MSTFKAILIEKDDEGYRANLKDVDAGQLPDGDVEIAVSHSTLNYKDALAITGKSPVVREFPMVPGIDLVGEVKSSRSNRFKPGATVVLNGYGVGEKWWGGLSERAVLKGDWLLKLPEAIKPAQAVAIGTAGYTAMLCVMALQRNGVKPDAGPILVTGACGGVGSVAIALLKANGFTVIASTGRKDEEEAYLKGLGADEIIDRRELSEPGKPIGKERWAGVVDTVGSHTLANACAMTQYGGTVTACGLAQGMDFPATVAPFILRGVTLAGVDSVMAPMELREEAWARLAKELDLSKLEKITTEISLDQAIDTATDLLDGKVRGRVVVAI